MTYQQLRIFLDELIASTDFTERLHADPVGIVRRYEDREDREVAALVASTLAYGRVALVREAATTILDRLGDHPAEALDHIEPSMFDDFVYRMTRGEDVVDLLEAIGSVRREWGSLEKCYASFGGDHLERASNLVRVLRARGVRSSASRGFRYLLPDPADGSATKRLHMFFRWVVRRDDGIDLGLWDPAYAAELLMPLDTHTNRLCRYLGLTARRAVDLRAAIEVSAALRAIRPEDPLVYDFPLAHLGISGRCIHRRSEEHCPGCPIEQVCKLE